MVSEFTNKTTKKQTYHLPKQSAKVLLLNGQVTIELSRRDEKPVGGT